MDKKVEISMLWQIYGNLLTEKQNEYIDYYYNQDLSLSEIAENDNFCLESKVELRHFSKNGKGFTRHAGYGKCELSKKGLLYVGEQDGELVEKLFSLDNMYRLLFGAGEDFEIYEGKEIYYFVPEDKRTCVLWYIVSGLLKK